MISREDSTITKNTVQTDLTYDPTRYHIGEHGFNFGVALVHSNGSNLMNDQSLLSMEISQVVWTGTEVGDNHTAYSNSLSYQV